MGRRLETPPSCTICSRPASTSGGYCTSCIKNQVFHEAMLDAWNENQVRIKGKLYKILPEPEPDPRLPFPSTSGFGFGGAWFRIKFHDGRVVQTRNLRSYGEIPDEYREVLPDNAVFQKPRKREKGGRPKRVPGR